MNTFSESMATALALMVSMDPALWSVVTRSLAVSGTATVLACCLGMAAGAWLGVARFRGRGVVVMLLNTALAVPAVVVGLVVYLLLSRSGPLGFLGWLFSFQAMVLAQAVLVLPIAMALTRQVIEDADRQHGEQLASLGAHTGWRAVVLAWDERYALLTVLLATFGRAIAEVGAVMIVGGNIVSSAATALKMLSITSGICSGNNMPGVPSVFPISCSKYSASWLSIKMSAVARDLKRYATSSPDST